MLDLNNVTLICLTNKDFEGHKKAIDESCKGIRWGAVKMVWPKENVSNPSDIKHWNNTRYPLEIIFPSFDIKSIDDWNKAIIYELHNYVQTDYAMLIHADGYVINPEAWRNEFLEYDYIGAPWPLPQDDYSYRTPGGELVRVGNSVSLRSRKILRLPSELKIPWRSYYGNTNEDGFLCCHNRELLIGAGCNFAPIEVARHFSKEHSIPENEGIETFAFHSII